jgi:hypothetical protein
MWVPIAVHTMGSHLYVADGNGRVDHWSDVAAAATTDGLSADDDINGTHGGGPAFSTPAQMTHTATNLYITDSGNGRVVVFPATPGGLTDPLYVLGQPAASNLLAMGCNNPSFSGGSMCTVSGVATDGTKLYVADTDNQRVLVWNTLPTAPTAADAAIGEPTGAGNLTSAWADLGKIDGALFNFAQTSRSDGTRFFVTDTNSSRVLVWSAVPMPGQSADFALGQPAGAANLTSFEFDQGGVTGANLNYPLDSFSDGTRLFVVDTGNNRVLVWNPIPTSPVAASFALGQPDLMQNGANNPALGGDTMNGPTSAWSDGTRLFVVDGQNNRVLVWNAMPTSNVAADFALGQPVAGNLTSNAPGVNADQLQSPVGIHSDGTRLFVADQANNRVLIWNHIPTSPVAADVVVGQAGFGANGLATTRDGLWGPVAVFSDGTRLWVADGSNHRVLRWDAIPTSHGAMASSVLGQPDFTSRLPNRGGALDASGLSAPNGVFADGERLFVTDGNNSRTRIYPIY